LEFGIHLDFAIWVLKLKMKTLFNKTELIAVYTMMKVLSRMRAELGLEACLEYMDKFITKIGGNSSNLNKAVEYILRNIDIENIYQEMN